MNAVLRPAPPTANDGSRDHDLGHDPTRRALLLATGVIAGAGLQATAFPVVALLVPSAQALAEGGPVEYDEVFRAEPANQLFKICWRQC